MMATRNPRLALARELIAQGLTAREAIAQVGRELPLTCQRQLFAVLVGSGKEILVGEAAPDETGVKAPCRENCPAEEHYHLVKLDIRPGW